MSLLRFCLFLSVCDKGGSQRAQFKNASHTAAGQALVSMLAVVAMLPEEKKAVSGCHEVDRVKLQEVHVCFNLFFFSFEYIQPDRVF